MIQKCVFCYKFFNGKPIYIKCVTYCILCLETSFLNLYKLFYQEQELYIRKSIYTIEYPRVPNIHERKKSDTYQRVECSVENLD